MRRRDASRRAVLAALGAMVMIASGVDRVTWGAPPHPTARDVACVRGGP